MNIIHRGFEILKTRPLEDKLDVSALEEEYNVNVPTNYRFFSELFYLNIEQKRDITLDNKVISVLRYLPQNNPLGDEIYFDDLFTLDFSLSTYEENDTWHSKGLMQVGDGPPDGGILICMEGVNKDSIFYNNGHKYVKLASHIFDFFRDVVIAQLDDPRENYNKLYKNWGEDFWRIRE